MILASEYASLLGSGIRSSVAFGNSDYDHIGSLLGESSLVLVRHQQELARIEDGMVYAVGPDLDEKMYKFVYELGTSGTIKNLRVKLFGINGEGGYWNMAKVQRRIKVEPDGYGLMMGMLWSSFVNKSAEGGQFNVNLFSSLVHATAQVCNQNLSPIVRLGIQDLAIEAVKKGVLDHDSISARMRTGGITAVSLYDYQDLIDNEERVLYFSHLVKTLDIPKTPHS